MEKKKRGRPRKYMRDTSVCSFRVSLGTKDMILKKYGSIQNFIKEALRVLLQVQE